MASVSIDCIDKNFGATSVLRGVSLSTADGELLTLLGPSGCGKSTLLRILAGLEVQDRGSISIGERVVDRLRPKRRDVSTVLQSYARYPHMTVSSNIALPLRIRRLSAGMVLIGLLLPHQLLSLPLFVLGYQLGILKTYAALIFPYVVSPFGIFLLRQFFQALPDDVVHAAGLDGLSEIAIVWCIMAPMALRAVIAFGIFSVVPHWNSLFWPLIAVRDQSLKPPPLGIMAFKDEEAGNDYGPLMAASTIVVAPLVIAFLAAQKWFVEGMTVGAVK
ncbi:ATP-binding cassette domain-containing protein [Bradyrhizobium sp. F1.13.3]|uniref:ATP-binding cassette domain-containing protein n=1 Tax=Bradyrhizobium sp. F1.13.3 TaxID=3156351 RepID=UPI003392BDF6